jgi:hypothetical protein
MWVESGPIVIYNDDEDCTEQMDEVEKHTRFPAAHARKFARHEFSRKPLVGSGLLL